MLINLIQKELNHFYKLSTDARSLLLSVTVYQIFSAITGIIINAFLWRHYNDIFHIAVFYFCVFAFIPLGFAINQLLLKKYNTKSLLIAGILLQPLTLGLLILFKPDSWLIFILLSLLPGIAYGIYWAARHNIIIGSTHDQHRNYFAGLEITLMSLIGIMIPIFTGWFIEIGEIFQIYSVYIAYVIVFIFSTCLSILSTFFIIKNKFPEITYTPVKKISGNHQWTITRCWIFSQGLINGFYLFYPIILIFLYIGKEGSLGTVMTISALFASLTTYQLGKHSQVSHRYQIFLIGQMMLALGSITLVIFFNSWSILISFCANAIFTVINWSVFSPILYEQVNNLEKNNKRQNLILDFEIFNDGGRVTAIFIFLVLLLNFDQQLILRYIPIIVLLIQFGLIKLTRILAKKDQSPEV